MSPGSITCPQVKLTQVVSTARSLLGLRLPAGQRDLLPLGLALAAPWAA